MESAGDHRDAVEGFGFQVVQLDFGFRGVDFLWKGRFPSLELRFLVVEPPITYILQLDDRLVHGHVVDLPILHQIIASLDVGIVRINLRRNPRQRDAGVRHRRHVQILDRRWNVANSLLEALNDVAGVR